MVLPAATLYVHMPLEQFLRETRGAARVDGLGPVIDLHESWVVDG